jgi:hypothetical protein
MISDTTSDTLSLMRRIVLGILAFEALGLLAELGLLGHFKSPTQVIAIALLVLVLISSVLAYRAKSVTTLRAFQIVMGLLMLGGAFGVVQHLEGNLAFSLELHPQMGFLERAWDVLKGATPALAPGTLVQMGLLGLVYTFRHPVLSGRTR